MDRALRLFAIHRDPSSADAMEQALKASRLAFVMNRIQGEERGRAAFVAGPPPDAILYDVDDGALHAPAILELAKKASPPVPVIIVAASIPPHRARAYVRAGAASVVSKERLARLPEALRHAVAKRPLGGALATRPARPSRERLLAELRVLEERHQLLFHGHPDPMWIQDTETRRLVEVNDAMLRRYGYTRDEALALRAMDLRQRDAAAATGDAAPGAEDGDEARVWRHVRKDGAVIEVEVASRAIVRDGRPCRLVVAHDVTERLRARAEVQTASEEWRQTIDAIDRAILVLDGRDAIRRLNRAALAVGGWGSYAEALGCSIPDLSRSSLWQTVTVLARAARTSGSPATTEVRDASRIWVVRASPMARLGGDPWVVVVLSDMTHEVGLLERGRGLTNLGALVQGVAHDVRNPIHFLGLAVDSLEERFGKSDEFAPYIKVFRAHLGQLHSLMRDLLDYGRPHHAAFSEFHEVGDVAEEAVTRCRALAAQSGILLRFRSGSLLGPVAVAREEIVRAIQNLLENAIQHSPTGSEVEVAVREVDDEAGSGVECSVRDRGRGIHAEDAPRVFEPFYTSRPGGTGLGLALAARIVSEHGGRVMVTNHPDGGAIFSIRLPRR